MGLFKKIFGDYSEREVKRTLPLVDKIDKLEQEVKNLSDEELKLKTGEFKDRYKNGESLDSLLVEAFSVVREASFRVLGLRHYREQLIGGIVLHQGRIAEMKTGEGKTLVATLPAYLNALSGKGVHIITVNDYLAKRDAEEMGKVFSFLGLTTGVIVHELTRDERKVAYGSDITYGTNNEFGFDYLKDNMVMYLNDKVQRELNFCIIDEVDSILIDEARTPLIISGQGEKSTEFYKIADSFVKTLNKEDYTIDEKGKAVMLSDSGVSKAERVFGLKNYADAENLSLQHHITQALKANYFMVLDKDYMVVDDEIIIVDEFTGRLMEGRRYSDGLHQAIEAKENVTVNRESKTLATITFQNLFRLYEKLSGMTGTALTEENEFREIYSLDCIAIPTHLPIAREDHTDLIYMSAKAKYNAIVKDIIDTNKKGQPVLVGTTSIEKSEFLSRLLKEKNIEHNVLNAKYHEQEAEIVADAGKFGKITIATNMAGRGTDIKLGEGSLEVGGLKIIGTERHESRRIDNQLRGRSGRQGDVGESRFYISLEDDLMRIFGSEKISEMVKKLGANENDVIENKFVSSSIESAQKKVEGAYFAARKQVLGYDDVMNSQRKIIYDQRNRVLAGENVRDQIIDMAYDIIDAIIDSHITEDLSIEELNDSYKTIIAHFETIFLPDDLVNPTDLENLSVFEIKEKFKSIALELYEEKESIFSPEEMREAERVVMLQCVDTHWMEHIDNMDHFKQGVRLRAYKQLDPVQVYQIEGSEMFNDMVQNIKLDTLKHIYTLGYKKEEEEEDDGSVG